MFCHRVLPTMFSLVHAHMNTLPPATRRNCDVWSTGFFLQRVEARQAHGSEPHMDAFLVASRSMASGNMPSVMSYSAPLHVQQAAPCAPSSARSALVARSGARLPGRPKCRILPHTGAMPRRSTRPFSQRVVGKNSRTRPRGSLAQRPKGYLCGGAAVDVGR